MILWLFATRQKLLAVQSVQLVYREYKGTPYSNNQKKGPILNLCTMGFDLWLRLYLQTFWVSNKEYDIVVYKIHYFAKHLPPPQQIHSHVKK